MPLMPRICPSMRLRRLIISFRSFSERSFFLQHSQVCSFSIWIMSPLCPIPCRGIFLYCIIYPLWVLCKNNFYYFPQKCGMLCHRLYLNEEENIEKISTKIIIWNRHPIPWYHVHRLSCQPFTDGFTENYFQTDRTAGRTNRNGNFFHAFSD